jgi:hypothetical protein
MKTQKNAMKTSWFFLPLALAMICPAQADDATNLISNPGFEERTGNSPAGFELTGGAEYRFLGNARTDSSSYGVGLSSDKPSGAVACIVGDLDARQGKWFRFAFRGLPQANFVVNSNDLYMKIEFFGQGGRVSYDAKEKKIYDQVQDLRRDLTVNGPRHQHGAEVWRNYLIDFCLPFPQVDRLKLTVGFGHGASAKSAEAEFFVDDMSLTRIPDPPNLPTPAARPGAIVPSGKLMPIGGRWFYVAREGETTVPKLFDASNADRLIYHDSIYSAPFAGNTSAWLRAGDVAKDGTIVADDRFIADNLTIQFSADSMILRTHGIPNHPTGRFPELGFGNPNYITEQVRSFYFPLAPRENPQHVAVTVDYSNRALPMGPIGLAVNGVVFFNPFDMGGQDATDMMDRCCGHPAPTGEYHYHKYPICVNSPWADDGSEHSPLLGWAFDGYPIYGPYESADIMAKDVTGEHALNAFNMHYDAERGWHYHVTPGKFPYLFGGFWGVEESRDARGRGGPGGPRGFGNGPGGPPPRQY